VSVRPTTGVAEKAFEFCTLNSSMKALQELEAYSLLPIHKSPEIFPAVKVP